MSQSFPLDKHHADRTVRENNEFSNGETSINQTVQKQVWTPWHLNVNAHWFILSTLREWLRIWHGERIKGQNSVVKSYSLCTELTTVERLTHLTQQLVHNASSHNSWRISNRRLLRFRITTDERKEKKKIIWKFEVQRWKKDKSCELSHQTDTIMCR